MPIPNFDRIFNVLPPFIDFPLLPDNSSPYRCTMQEFGERFATNDDRKLLIKGLLTLRKLLMEKGFRGFQWIDGSFTENVEASEKRTPGDIDVVTFISEPGAVNEAWEAIKRDPSIFDAQWCKERYRIDHYYINLNWAGDFLVENTHIYSQLFSHRKKDGLRKGMIRLELATPSEDEAVYNMVGGLP